MLNNQRVPQLQGTTSSGVLVIYGALDDPELGAFLEVLGGVKDTEVFAVQTDVRL